VITLKQTEVFRKWENKLKDKQVKALIAARLLRLANGLSGDVEPVGNGISELRIHHGKGYRIYFKKIENTIIILLCGGDKSTQEKDILKAKTIAQEV